MTNSQPSKTERRSAFGVLSKTFDLITQDRKTSWRKRPWVPEWVRQMPYFPSIPAGSPDFRLIDRTLANQLLADPAIDDAARKQINDDLDFMENELLKRFRDHDTEASEQQNRYRQYQIAYILLSALATIFGSIQSLSLSNSPGNVPFWAFIETLIALLSTFLAAISGREPPFERWMVNRQRAEGLRRECFRYLACLNPYDSVDGYSRRQLFKERMANINRGVFPTNPPPPPSASG